MGRCNTPFESNLQRKQKLKSLAMVGSTGTLPWLRIDRVQPNRQLTCGSIVESTHWRVLRRPSEPAAVTGKVGTGTRVGY